jgi:catechol 2,3-dioxygenase-like lactoylglutathione lyase family enzyme
MSATEVPNTAAAGNESVPDMKLEVVVIPVSDVDRAKEFYGRLGWRLDADVNISGSQLVQLTPPGSGCSVQFGTHVTSAAPGSAQSTYLVVSDIEAARTDLISRGASVSPVFHEGEVGDRFLKEGSEGRIEGGSPGSNSYGSFATFNDPDDNVWLLQEVTTRLPNRVEGAVYPTVSELANALRRAEAAHGEHEKRIGQADANWPDWYAAYMVAENSGAELPL